MFIYEFFPYTFNATWSQFDSVEEKNKSFRVSISVSWKRFSYSCHGRLASRLGYQKLSANNFQLTMSRLTLYNYLE